MGVDNKPKLDNELIDRQENTAPGSREYWTSLILFGKMNQPVSTTTENTPVEQRTQMQEMWQKRKGIAKRQRKRYTAQKESHKKHGGAKEAQGMASNLFNNQVLYASLVTAQHNASNFYAFSTVFCAMADRLAPAPMNLPNVKSVRESCTSAITEDPSECAVTDESDNAHINEEHVVNQEEEADLESGIAND